MRTGRNAGQLGELAKLSLDHWDMRTGRNSNLPEFKAHASLDHWDMRTGRNPPFFIEFFSDSLVWCLKNR